METMNDNFYNDPDWRQAEVSALGIQAYAGLFKSDLSGLIRNCGLLMRMATQKTSGQKAKGYLNADDIPFENWDRIRWNTLLHACIFVASGDAEKCLKWLEAQES